jgi:gliding motility-associated lipoprotein GldH
MMKFKKIIFIAILSIVVFSCEDNSIWKGHEDLKDGNWYVKKVPTFTFEVKDENQEYNISYLIRNAVQYPYYNLYITRELYDDKGTLMNTKLEEVILFDQKTGKPLGDGLGDLFDHKILSYKNLKFPKKGKYTIKLKQFMRQNPLIGIMSVGINVERIVAAK